MFLKKITIHELIILLGISIYAFIINWFSGNIGIIPIDSFGFLDTGHSILNGKLPIRDFWIFTGLLVDYMEAFFLFAFGNNWNSHLIHSSFMNILASIFLYFFLRSFKLEKKYIIFYCISFATLCYPVSGTPFAYIHSYIFSLISIMTLILAIKTNNKFIWLLFPFICFFSFLSMQTPSVYILLILFLVSIYQFVKTRDYEPLKFFVLGCTISILLFLGFLFVTQTPLSNFLYQYILFPLTIGEGRISSSETAYVSLVNQINFKRLFGDFKFIHFLLFPLIFFAIKNFKKNKRIINILNVTFLLSVLAFLFNQLITANQIFIFSLIPIIGSLLHLNLLKTRDKSKKILIILIIVLFATVKFHYRYNIDRKFHDLENIDKSLAINANEIHENLKDLKWINRFDDPRKEVEFLKQAIEIIKNEKREIVLITHYQFISTILDKKINILNRWYLWDNNTHPTENHKYFSVYKSLVDKNIQSNNVKAVYLLGQENEILIENVKNYFTDLCFKSKTLVKKRFSIHEIVNCKK